MSKFEKGSLAVGSLAWALLALVLLLGIEFQLHELAHHFLSAALCHRFGSVSFDYYESAQGCAPAWQNIAEIFGPFVSMCLAYAGALWLARRSSLMAFGVIFASYFHLRFIPPLLGGGDEMDLVRKLHLPVPHWTVALALLLLSLPPLWVAWRSLAPRRRVLLFALAYFVPLPFVWYADPIAGWISGPTALVPALSRRVWLGIPLSLIVCDMTIIAAFSILLRLRGRAMQAAAPS